MKAKIRVLIKIFLTLLILFALIIALIIAFLIIYHLFKDSTPPINLAHTSTNFPTQSPTLVPSTTPAPSMVPTTSTTIPTSKPTSPPTATPCIYGVTLYGTPSPQVWFVDSSQLLNLPLKNTGTCSWPKGTSLELISPDLNASVEAWLQEDELNAGGLFTASINLIAPSSPQTLTLTWQLKTDEQTVGSAITHTLKIIFPLPTLTPTPTSTPASTLTPTNEPPSPPRKTSPPPSPTRVTQPPPAPTRVTITSSKSN
jgi:hypothetical protein